MISGSDGFGIRIGAETVAITSWCTQKNKLRLDGLKNLERVTTVMLDPELAWTQFQSGTYGSIEETVSPASTVKSTSVPLVSKDQPAVDTEPDCCSPLYISTKTKIAYLNQTIPLASVFWQIPVSAYHLPASGVLKKQMKFNSGDAEALANMNAKLETEKNTSHAHIEEHVITHIENPGGRIPFKDVRKISVGLCRKDVTSYRSKKKGAFYNCFVVILRLEWEKRYKEIHIKVFNTGKLEVPGIRNDALLNKALLLLTDILQPLMPKDTEPLLHVPERSETVLVNSNFACNFYLDRQKLFKILRNKYDISCSYDPCSYPGIQAEFYYRTGEDKQTGCLPLRGGADQEERVARGDITKVSFMIFRTGSVLIVGKCTDEALYDIYHFICNILHTEKETISLGPAPVEHSSGSGSKRSRKRTITVHGCVSPEAS